MCKCGVCGTKIVKTFTKKAYHGGVVVVRCDGCESDHLIADNLGWFSSKPTNIEEICQQKGNTVIKVEASQAVNQALREVKFVGAKETTTIQNDYERR
mmetsp:Transcript_12752/g.10898  ORF Transcript_12752/g.10898 Transcript_12752/m.10898 type:complete len:98 (-) Transcript_12752:148-441(-)